MVLGGFILATLILFIGNYIIIHQRNSKRKDRSFKGVDFSKPLIINAATIADDLFPVTDALDLDKAVIDIVGGDAEYIVLGNGHRLKAGLREWLERGASIRYHLVCPSDAVLQEFENFSTEMGDSFQVLVLDRCERNFEFKTLHPTLFKLNGEDKTAMWIEYNHPLNSKIAYNVKFVGPEAMKASPTEAEEYKHFESKIFELSQQAA